ncbi:MAG: DNA replication/repair protein RecF [Lentisphaerae bacterium]|nr:DNA replication/repair protein RecF [Lentisphaerota bacterium]
MIDEFRILNWRSFLRTRFVFERKNLLVGPNGSGKSNLLEALGFLGILRSFRTGRLNELVNQQCDMFALRGSWQDSSHRVTQLECSVDRSGKRTLLVNGHAESSGRDFIQHFYPVVFAPEDMEIVCGQPAVRRKFFDMIACQLDDGYINVLHDYQKALKLRNLLLKSTSGNRARLEVYEGLLAFAGADLTLRRRRWLEKFNQVLAVLTPAAPEQLQIQYKMQCDGTAEGFLEQFARNRAREIEKRTTLSGCHLDDYIMLRGNHIMRNFASNGQNRLAALHCKLASALLLMQNRGAENLVALVDDVTGELDESNRRKFYELLKPAGQSFFTFTQKPDEKFFNEAKLFDFQNMTSA